ncbi:MAG TPA: tRNA guanosine(34) transglycosylase Tgt [Acidimicrobiales bacterium]|nr:tRNA guanosine(34) transglycosylase Tgt [Acidimicrobiales bacterium]
MKHILTVEAQEGRARAGRVVTPRGEYRTPVFMPVGTRGAVRTLAADDLERLGVQIVLGNTYHLMLRPGADLIDRLGGLHGFTDWGGHVLTDSGGYQILSLEPKIDDEGAVFRSTYDGSTHRLTPEGAAEIQCALGSDIQMVLDVCPPLPSPPEVVRAAVDRTSLWAARGRAAFLAERERRLDSGRDPAQFGIVQGGVDAALRVESARRTVEVGFDGYAVGGLSVGETRDQMVEALAAAVDELPADQPRYFMGLGDPVGLVEAVHLGIDMFDCVLPTRLGRHGTVLTSEGRMNLRNARFATDDGPLDPGFPTDPSGRYSRAYLRHLLSVDEPTAARVLTLHNVAWTLDLVDSMRAAIVDGTFADRRRRILDVWAPRRAGDGHGAD